MLFLVLLNKSHRKNQNFLICLNVKGAIHKRSLLKEGGRGQKCQNLLSKKVIKGEGGGHKIEKMGRFRL